MRRVDEVAYAATAIRLSMSNMLNAPTPLSNVDLRREVRGGDGDDEMMYGRFEPGYTWHRFGGKHFRKHAYTWHRFGGKHLALDSIEVLPTWQAMIGVNFRLSY